MNKLNIIFLTLIFFITKLNFSQTKEKTYHNSIRLNYMAVNMPNTIKRFKEPKMGLGGLHYQIPLNKTLYVSGGMYFALLGDQGGLFTLGTALGFNTPIYKNFYLDGNIHFGGGGGYRVLINDGSYFNSNIGIEYKVKNFAAGIQYSYLNFISGDVRDDSMSFYIQIPSAIHTSTKYNKTNQTLNYNTLSSLNGFNRKASKRGLIVRFDVFNPIKNSRKDTGKPLTNKLHLLGFEYQKHLTKNFFLYAHTDAIYKGLRAGFMSLFVGGGFHPIITNFLNLTTKIGFGAAGGRIYPEGGLTFYPSINLNIKTFNNFYIVPHLGYLKALDGNFEAKTFGLSFKHIIKTGGRLSFEDDKRYSEFITKSFQISLQNQTYLKVPKTDDLENKLEADLQLLAIKINYNLTQFLYSFGEAGFTYKERSGGYAHGLMGFGGYSPNFFNNRCKTFLELSVGVAGGGGIDTKQGIIFRPNLGINYKLNDQFSITTSGGKFISYSKSLNSLNFNIGINFKFASLLVKK